MTTMLCGARAWLYSYGALFCQPMGSKGKRKIIFIIWQNFPFLQFGNKKDFYFPFLAKDFWGKKGKKKKPTKRKKRRILLGLCMEPLGAEKGKSSPVIVEDFEAETTKDCHWHQKRVLVSQVACKVPWVLIPNTPKFSLYFYALISQTEPTLLTKLGSKCDDNTHEQTIL